MARRRMIDPNFWQSEDVYKLTIRQRLLFIGLFSNADDEGKLRGNPAFIRSIIFPYEDFNISDIEHDLLMIKQIESIKQYEIEGSKYIKITNWFKFQRVDKPQPSMIPNPINNESNNESNNDSNDQENDQENDYCLKEKKLKEKKLKEDKLREGNARDPDIIELDSIEIQKERISKQLIESETTNFTLYHLDILNSYIGVVEIEVIEAAIKKGQKKHVQYTITTLENWVKEGKVRKEHILPKPEPGVYEKGSTNRNGNSGKPKLSIIGDKGNDDSLSENEITGMLIKSHKLDNLPPPNEEQIKEFISKMNSQRGSPVETH